MQLTGVDAAFVIFVLIIGFLVWKGKISIPTLILSVTFGLLFAGTFFGAEFGDWVRDSLNSGWSRIASR